MARTLMLEDDWVAIIGSGQNGETAIFNDRTKEGINEHGEPFWLIPSTVLKAIVAYEVRNSKISALEQASDDELLGLHN